MGGVIAHDNAFMPYAPGHYTVRRTIQTLDALAEGPVTARSLADTLGIVPRTSRRFLRALEHDGLVTRTVGPHRAGYWAATDKLRQLGQRIASAPDRRLCDPMRGRRGSCG
jgi:DNA-binding IclR family transcriptional regulator